MKLAITQPYLFPYVRCFQLVAAVDRSVFYDDVNFIKNVTGTQQMRAVDILVALLK
ncbi:WbqC family protein [Paraburkholderia sp. RL17-337-BIB-A]|uniref:WbqC family protein n=1 Tax=Paraburkholderia sp. RL17-337-BIB-A TaxID=3031636 RepID=UPI0038BDE88D